MTRDTRDPSELYDRMMHEMRVHHCSILEAADRVELHRGLGSEQAHAGPVRLPPGTPDVARITPSNGSQP